MHCSLVIDCAYTPHNLTGWFPRISKDVILTILTKYNQLRVISAGNESRLARIQSLAAPAISKKTDGTNIITLGNYTVSVISTFTYENTHWHHPTITYVSSKHGVKSGSRNGEKGP